MADIEEIARLSIAAWNANDWDALERHSDPGIVASGLPMDLEVWIVNRFAGDRVARIEYYLEEASARGAR